MSDYLPDEVITNILLRLPSKSLIMCTSVCKSWRSMIKDSSFIGAHLSRTIDFNNRHGTHLLLLHRFSIKDSYIWGYNSTDPGVKNDVYSLHYDNNDFDECCEIGFQCPIADSKMHHKSFRVVGVCNGLVCLVDDLERKGYNFLIWNPYIRKLVILPKPGLTYQTVRGYDVPHEFVFDASTNDYEVVSHGFAFDASTNDYKVVRLVDVGRGWNGNEKLENQSFVEVYSLAAGSWSNPRLVDHQCVLCGPSAHQAFVNGALHWDVWSKLGDLHCYSILAFNVGSELFREIMMPKGLDTKSSDLNHLIMLSSVSGDGKSLALFVTYPSYTNASFLDVWVMKEYCVGRSWTKLITLHPQSPGGSLPRALCFRKSGEVVLRNHDDGVDKEELVSLDLVSGQIKNLGICGYRYYTIDPYEESLVLLDRNEAVSY